MQLTPRGRRLRDGVVFFVSVTAGWVGLYACAVIGASRG